MTQDWSGFTIHPPSFKHGRVYHMKSERTADFHAAINVAYRTLPPPGHYTVIQEWDNRCEPLRAWHIAAHPSLHHWQVRP